MSNSPLTGAVAALLGTQDSLSLRPLPCLSLAGIICDEAFTPFVRSMFDAGFVVMDTEASDILHYAYDALEAAKLQAESTNVPQLLQGQPRCVVALEMFEARCARNGYLHGEDAAHVLVLAGEAIVVAQKTVLHAVERGCL